VADVVPGLLQDLLKAVSGDVFHPALHDLPHHGFPRKVQVHKTQDLVLHSQHLTRIPVAVAPLEGEQGMDLFTVHAMVKAGVQVVPHVLPLGSIHFRVRLDLFTDLMANALRVL
jgi:hypothetical protein